MGHPILCSGYLTSHRTSELEEASELNLSKPLTLQMRKPRLKGSGPPKVTVSVTGLG